MNKTLALTIKEVLVANVKQLVRLKLGIKGWNEWRSKNPQVEINLSRASFRGADLRRANLIEANFTEVNLRWAYLSEVNFNRSDLSRANLSYTRSSEVNLSNANLSNANLSNANLSLADCTNANFSEANLSNANLSNANLSLADFTNANFSEANLSNANLSNANLSNANLTFANLCNANLSNANLSGVDLRGVDFTNANLGNANLTWADLREVHLIGIASGSSRVANLSNANLTFANLSNANLSNANLSNANLSNANLTWANLSNVNLSKADVSRVNCSGVNLSRVKAFDTNFTGAKLTGACIEYWNINSETKLHDVECDYVYLKYPNQERRPSDLSRNFALEEFTKLFQEARNTFDLILHNGINWRAFAFAFNETNTEVIDEYGDRLFLRGYELLGDGMVKLRISYPEGANRQKYQNLLEESYELLKENKGLLKENARLQGEDYEKMLSLPGRVIVIGDNNSVDTRNINTGGGSYYETINTGGGNYIQGNYVNMSQDLTEAAGQIQELLNQLQKSGVTVEAAQEQVATDLAKQAESNPTVMGKLVGWGKTMANKASETTVSEAAKAIVPLALKLVGIPLP